MVGAAVGFLSTKWSAVCACKVLLVVAIYRCEIAYVETNLIVHVPCAAQTYGVAVAGE